MCNNVTIRKFDIDDINNKIKWINNSENNEFLHYNLPLEYKKTLEWYLKNKGNKKRHDMIIEYNNIPVGVIGIINIKDRKGEFYITLGESKFKRKGISFEATKQIIELAFKSFNIDKIWLCVDEDNLAARRLYEKVGFKQEGLLREDIFFKGKMINRCMYGILKKEWRKST